MTNLRLNRSFNSFCIPTCLSLLFSFLLSLSSLDIFTYSEASPILQNNKRKLWLDPVAYLMPCNCSFLPQPLAIFMINLHSLLLPPTIHAPLKPLLSKFQARHSSETDLSETLNGFLPANSNDFSPPSYSKSLVTIHFPWHLNTTLYWISFFPSNHCLGFKQYLFLRNSSSYIKIYPLYKSKYFQYNFKSPNWDY